LKSNIKDIELLNELLQDKLDEETTAQINERLGREVDLAEDFEFLKVMAGAVRVTALQSKLEMLQHEEAKISSLNNGKGFKWWWLLTLLAIMALLVFGWKYFQYSKDEISYNPVFVSDFDSELILHKTYRSENNTEELTIDQQRAYEMYSLQMFDEAIPLLEQLWEVERDTLALFYLGVSYFGVGDEERGRETLNKEVLSQYRDKIDIFNN
jgi:tetratricopeptide (TPR) repeat protein